MIETNAIYFLDELVIAQVVERYLNKEVFKKPVKVVESKGTENGYMFRLERVMSGVQSSITNTSSATDTQNVEPKEEKPETNNKRGKK